MASGKEICVMGDTNLNFLNWMNSNSTSTSHARRLKPLVTVLFDKIIPNGFIQLVSEATRFRSGTEPSGLDHFYTNRPDHMSDVKVHFKGSSDHRMVSVTRFTKSVVRKTRLIRRRYLKYLDPADFLRAIKCFLARALFE